MDSQSAIDIQSDELIETLKLFPAFIPGLVTPVEPSDLAHGGVGRHLFVGEPKRLPCVVDPWSALQRRKAQPMAAFDTVKLYVNRTFVDSSTVLEGDESKRVLLFARQGSFVDGVNEIQYEVERLSGNTESSDILRVLYHQRPHANLELVIPPEVIAKGVTPELAAQGIKFECRYVPVELHDALSLKIADKRFPIPVTDPTKPLTITLYTADLIDIIDGTVQAWFTVEDQLNNFAESAIQTLEIRLAQKDLISTLVLVPSENPIAVPIDPNGVITRFEAKAANVGDVVELQMLNPLPGTPPAAPLKLNKNLRANFNLSQALLTAHQGRVLRLQCVLNNNGAEHTSPILRVRIPAPLLDLNFRDAPYSAVTDGLLTDISLELLKNGSPQPGQNVVITLPVGFAYGDGGTGSRTFTTDSLGIVTVGDVRTPSVIDSYTLTASSEGQTATATVEVEHPGVVDWIEMNSAPVNIVITPDGKHLYAPLASISTVAVIDTQKLQVIRNIPVEIGPQTISISPDGTRAYTTNRNNNVYEIDIGQQAVTRRLSVGSELAFVSAVSRDSSKTYISTWEYEKLHVCDAKTGAKIKETNLHNRPSWLHFSNDGRRLYVALNGTPDRLDILDAVSLSVIRQIGLPSGSNPIHVASSNDERFVYVVLYSKNEVAVIDTASMSVLKYIPVGSFPYAIVTNSQGTLAYVTNFLPGSVSVIDLSRQEVVGTLPLGGGTAYGIALSPDGRRAYVCNTSNSRIAVLRIG
ncbi:beta-propeller fold lactonase family protein [Pseudomonas sp. M20]|uniref:beta-propeller fold lactonase family protein n=1 Tax=Pseudomonas sp. M20 TaxID=3379129 RepID=UPI003869B5BB